MKAIEHFRSDQDFAIENLFLEAKRFGSISQLRNKGKKDYESARTSKIKFLKRRSGGSDELWKGLT